MPRMMTREEVMALQPCSEAMAKIDRLNLSWPVNAEQARKAGVTFSDMLWVAKRILTRRKQTLWAADCAERVLPIFEKARPGDTRPRKAIEAARHHAVADAAADAVAAAAADAVAAAAADAVAAAAAAAAAYAADAVAAAYAAAYAAHAAADADAADAAAAAAAAAAHAAAAAAAERTWQYDRLIHYLS